MVLGDQYQYLRRWLLCRWKACADVLVRDAHWRGVHRCPPPRDVKCCSLASWFSVCDRSFVLVALFHHLPMDNTVFRFIRDFDAKGETSGGVWVVVVAFEGGPR